MFKIKKLWPLGLLVLAACSSPDGQTIIPFPLGGGGGGGSSSGGSIWPGSTTAPAEPMMPPVYEAREGRPEGSYEQHGAVGPQGCQEMAERFKKEGRRVTAQIHYSQLP